VTHTVARPAGTARAAGLLAAVALTGCTLALPGGPGWPGAAPAKDVPGGDPQRGRAVMARYGCAACHSIPGVVGARGRVGPPLGGIADRAIIAGKLPNTPENLIRWIQHPQAVEPGNVMPEMGVTEADARDIAAYLYTLR
jgi:cytochrome c2